MQFRIEKSWHKVLADELKKPYIEDLKAFLEREKQEGKEVYPPESFIFNAFRQTPFTQVKAVIMGQDPYHGPGQAHGLSFSVPPGVKPPPSLKNIYKELYRDLNITPALTGCLIPWAQQGVLLLNATLTVRRGEPRSHHGKGWELFTDAVIKKLCEREDPIVFLLWGKSAQEKLKCAQTINPNHLFLTAAHPSPYSAHLFHGCAHFSKTNDFLKKWGKSPIDWSLDLRKEQVEVSVKANALQ